LARATGGRKGKKFKAQFGNKGASARKRTRGGYGQKGRETKTLHIFGLKSQGGGGAWQSGGPVVPGKWVGGDSRPQQNKVSYGGLDHHRKNVIAHRWCDTCLLLGHVEAAQEEGEGQRNRQIMKEPKEEALIIDKPLLN